MDDKEKFLFHFSETPPPQHHNSASSSTPPRLTGKRDFQTAGTDRRTRGAGLAQTGGLISWVMLTSDQEAVWTAIFVSKQTAASLTNGYCLK